MLLKRLNVRYNNILIMPILKIRFSTLFEGFSSENFDSQRHFLTLKKPWKILREKSHLNKKNVHEKKIFFPLGACAARVGAREDHSSQLLNSNSQALIFLHFFSHSLRSRINLLGKQHFLKSRLKSLNINLKAKITF